MAILANSEVDLRHRVKARAAPGVDQERDLNAVAGAERKPFEQGALGGCLARQRLIEHREVWSMEVQQRSRQELGDAATTVVADLVAEAKRTAERALDESNLRLAHERPEQPRNELRVEVDRVGVNERDKVAVS